MIPPRCPIFWSQFDGKGAGPSRTYIAESEIASLEHEFGDDTVKLGALVPKPLFTSAEGTEILHSFRDDIVAKLEVDAAGATCVCDQS